jgi:hypothetical protein
MNTYKIQVDYTYNINSGDLVTSSVYYGTLAETSEIASASIQNMIGNNSTTTKMKYENEIHLVAINTGVISNIIIE